MRSQFIDNNIRALRWFLCYILPHVSMTEVDGQSSSLMVHALSSTVSRAEVMVDECVMFVHVHV